MAGNGFVRVATLVACAPTTLGPSVVESGAAGIFFQGKAVLARRPGYEDLDLSDRRLVPVRRTVTSDTGRLLRASFYIPIGDRLAERQARKARLKGGVA